MEYVPDTATIKLMTVNVKDIEKTIPPGDLLMWSQVRFAAHQVFGYALPFVAEA